MKNKLIIIATALTLISGLGYFSAQHFTAMKPVDKNINVEVYKAASYVSPAYANATATLEVTVVRVHGNKRAIAFQHTFQPTELKNFPASDKPLMQKISIPNVNDKKDKLEVYYKVTYNSQGSVLDAWNTATIGRGQQTGKLHIQI